MRCTLRTSQRFGHGHKEASDVSPADAPATAEEPHQHQHHQHVASSREQRRERRRELLEAAKQELEWRVFIASRKSHESTTSATPPPPPSAVTIEPGPAPPVADAAASPTTKSGTTANDEEEHPERKREDLGRRMMRRRLRRVARESRDHRLPENVWGAFRQFEVLLAEPTRSLEEVQKAVDEWYGRLPFRPNFRAELDMSKALHTYVPFWHFACNTACQYQGRARIGRRFAAKYGEKTSGTLSTAFPVLICAEEPTPKRKPVLASIDDLKWHEVSAEGRLVSLTARSESSLKEVLDAHLRPTDRVMDLTLQPQAAWQREGRKRLEEVERELSERAIIESERARGVLRPNNDADGEAWEVDLDYVARTDQEREQGMGRVSLVLVPVYELHYRWHGFEYHLCVRDGDHAVGSPQPDSGERPLPLIEGARPYSYAKISLAGLAGLGVGLASYWMITH
ncbi:uncharacterized protein ACA1_187260 [Acanthamoeba castellanii str. Neff]|uniref:Uncharacterized protein n=1 Tax=Acanthamoeba castellanii (strain ATCC 30010 / Neff) TaxID=1257118 RepID=L8GS69_ACACF|nr:uncharacterized protein ACA1_187260 [Acanthamoeba castellanii str. Neff]ELR15840.1 hypothetical protein ACA1_187260 [Acanthamoeba castellanii str. Neff]